MNHLFDPENRFWSFMNKITDVFLLGVLWLLFSVPVFTIGAATTSLYQFTLKQTDNEEGYVWKSFVKAFRKNFRQATALWLMLLAAGAFLAADVYACLHITVPGAVRILCFGLLLCLCLIFVLSALYVFPILSRFERKTGTILRHSFIMAMGNLYISVTVLVIYAAAAALTYYWTVLLPIWMALAAFFSSYLFRYVFSRYFPDQEE
ncbi:MAG: YesL family protein [Lachnospiraceae bacterium]|nr:YesL family protein [Lachnospiraceae bacterium]